MTFVRCDDQHGGPTEPGFTVRAGAREGLRTVMLATGLLPSGDVGAMHHHGGDEIIRVVSGRMVIRVGDQRCSRDPGQTAVIPPAIPHGFVVESEAVIELVAEQQMGSYYTIRHADRTTAVVEVHPRRRTVGPAAAGRDRHHARPHG